MEPGIVHASITKSVNADWGIYIKCLETGKEIVLDADRPMETISVIQISLMVEAFRQLGEGKVALTDRISLTDAAKRVMVRQSHAPPKNRRKTTPSTA